jgi:integrase/recombinase XerD
MKTSLGAIISSFFRLHLCKEKGLSPNTIASYSDCIRLLLEFCCARFKVKVDAIAVTDLSDQLILNFLDFLEQQRANSAQTRNQRLGALKTFFRFIAAQDPSLLDTCQRVCAIKKKKTEHKIIESLEKKEVSSIINMIDLNTFKGIRDYCLLMFMHNTGARVQEICDLKIEDISCSHPQQVVLTGKGRKQRVVPLWNETVEAIKNYLDVRNPKAGDQEKHLFLNSRGVSISRYGIGYIVDKYTQKAGLECSSLEKKKVSPHTFRHTTALHLLQSGSDIVTIQHWLGHADIKTTMQYIQIDTEMKRAALQAYSPPLANSDTLSKNWNKPSIIQFLRSLSQPYYVE